MTSLMLNTHSISKQHAPEQHSLGNSACPIAKLKLDQLFLQWLSEHQEVVTGLIEDARAGKTLRSPAQVSSASPLSPSTSHLVFSSTPPMSPSKTRSPSTPISPHRRSLSTLGQKRAPLATIPQFYPAPKPAPAESAQKGLREQLEQHYIGHAPGMPHKEFVEMFQQVFDVPTMVAHTVFMRLVGNANGSCSKDAFLKFLAGRDLAPSSPHKRVFELLRQEGKSEIVSDDLRHLMDCVIQFHPALEFLAGTAEFQEKYAKTVVYRIMYTLNRKGDGCITLREFQRSDLLEALFSLDQEEDINKVLKYFCYEHFYVIYCKFWELDKDHDFMLDRNDLAHYGQCALSFNIVDRIFDQAPRPLTCETPGRMNYEDFVWFILSEEDKSTDTALEYWFRCVDLDGDGCIRPREMWHFYEEQLRRLEGGGQEPVLFEDLVCQLHDMLAPAKEGVYTLRDLKRARPQSRLLFDSLFHLHKFNQWENRDPFAVRAENIEYAGLSDWEKFAKIEYVRLASEEDTDAGMAANEDFEDGANQ